MERYRTDKVTQPTAVQTTDVGVSGGGGGGSGR
jgi:hypothetical protein